jgi:putative tricarboxylic transport membrane protein
MAELLAPLIGGIGLFFVPTVAIALLGGMIWGSIAGAMPGFNQTLAVGVMIPFTFAMGPVEAVAYLVAISVGVSYGNSIPAILIGLPGTPSAVLTALDGHALHKKGESGLALGVSYFAAFSGQFVSCFFFILMVVPLSQLAYHFLAPELFALQMLGITAIVSLTGKNVFKGILAAAFGFGLTMIGPDPIGNNPRFTFGIPEMRSGLQIVPVALGLLAVSEIIRSARQAHDWSGLVGSFVAKFPAWSRLRRTVPAVAGGTVVGMLIGSIPGMGGAPAAAVAYQQARLISKRPEEFGHGSIEGVAANEAAQNAAQSGEMVPTLGLGIPGSDSMVLLLGALSIHGIVPGPLLAQQTPEMLHAAVAGLLGTSILLALLGWPIARSLLRIATLKRAAVLTCALALTIVGVYSMRQSLFDVKVMLVCGIVGYFMLRYGYSTAAAAIAVVLGAGAERSLRTGLNLTSNDWLAFVGRPITASILAIALVFLIYGIWGTVRQVRMDRSIEAGQTGSNREDTE